MAAFDLFTNADKSEDVDVKAPAFSLTKIGTVLAGVVLALLGAFPKAVQEDTTIDVAVIAAATLVVLGVLALWAVDILTRQRAAEAKLRYGGQGDDNGAAPEHFFALPDVDDLKLQVGPNAPEYKVYAAEVNGGQVTLHAKHDGKPLTETTFTLPKP